MKINRKNYEIFMLDYIEGNLPLDIKEDFVTFLNMNPDVKTQSEDLNEYKLECNLVLFNSKNMLKKDPELDIPGISKFEQLSIAHIEKDISQSEKIHLDEILNKSKGKQKELLVFQKTILKPDLSIVFKNKSYLKHKTITNIYMYMALAASLVLLLAFALFLPSENSSNLGLALTKTRSTKVYKRPAYQTDIINKDEIFIKTKQIENQFQIFNEPEFPDSNGLNTILPVKNTFIEQITNDDIALNINDIIFYNKQDVQPKSVSVQKIGKFLNNQLKNKVLKLPANEKTTLASIGKFIGKSLSKISNKNLKIDKKVMDDGSTLYAFKAGSVEIYTNIKPSRKTDPTYNSERNNRPHSNRE